MKNIRQMSYEEMKALPRYGLDDKVILGCKSCGKCCLNRHDIILTPYDVFRIARYLKRSPEEIIERYCDWYIGRISKIPIAHLMPIAPRDACPFLRNKKCSIHVAKPVVCKIFPFARLTRVEHEEKQYVLGQASCGENPPMREYTVRDWVQDVASEEAKSAAKIWGEKISLISHAVSGVVDGLKEKDSDLLYNIMFIALYFNYSTDEDFGKQLAYNAEKVISLLAEYKEIADKSGKDNT